MLDHPTACLNKLGELQVARSRHAVLAARALARCSGGRGEHSPAAYTPAQQALAALLTDTLEKRIGDTNPAPLLCLLNSSVQTPQVGLLMSPPLSSSALVKRLDNGMATRY